MAKNFSFFWAIFIFIQLNGVSFIKAHVGLTFPPARKYDLDFLDNIRSRAPCGMPKGKSRTQLMAGSTVNITWHLAYPHRGGYKLELFDMNEKYLMDLTPKENNEEYVLGDATAQWHSVAFSKDVICKDCTIRLIRTAKEWANSYRFWSCADVDIVDKDDYKRTCSGHGKLDTTNGLCACDKRFWGPDCAYEDECIDDRDCGGTSKGQCVDLGGTALPRKQCFCAPGYHGEKCSKENKDKLADSKSLDLSNHKKNVLSDRFSLFYKVIPAAQDSDKEIEFVLVINGTSYGALGWRSSETEAVCKQWPFINDIEQRGRREAKPTASAVAEPESEPEAEAEPTKGRIGSQAEPESESEPEKHHDSKAEPESEPESHKRNYKSGKPHPEPETEPESEANSRKGIKAEPEPESEPTSEPEPESEGSTKSEPESTKDKNRKSSSAIPEPESPTHEPISEPESSKSKNKAHPEPEPETESKPHAEPEPETGSKPHAGPEPEAESSKEGHASPESESEPAAINKRKYDTSPKSEPNRNAHTKPEPESEAEATTSSEPEPEAEAESTSKHKHSPTSIPEPEKESEPEPESKPSKNKTVKPHAEPEPESESKPNENKNVKPHAEPEPESESKPNKNKNVKPHAEPEPESESKPNKNKNMKPHAEAEAEPESSKSKTKIISKPEKLKESTAEPHAEPESEPHAEPESEPHAESESEPESNKKPEKSKIKPSLFKKTSNAKLEAEPESEPKMPQRIFRENESLLRPVRKSEKNRPRIRSKALEQGSGETYTISSMEQETTTIVAEVMELKETKTIRKLKESPYTPKGDFHSMDCTDIILGSARGSYSRIMDYYTRDRSTPRLDSFYGGTNNILSATGWEMDGQTTLVFRRKLLSEDPADHSLSGEMHVIWARGQESGQYVHKPQSGLETETASNPEFYAKDEIKYHGRQGQRGVTFINFSD